jgi:hypothetical protein
MERSPSAAFWTRLGRNAESLLPRERAPQPLRAPPQNDSAKGCRSSEGMPSVRTKREQSQRKNHYEKNHRQIERPRESAVGSAAATSIHHACHTHPDQRDRPDGRAQCWLEQAAGQHGSRRNAPDHRKRAPVAGPVPAASRRAGCALLRHAQSPRSMTVSQRQPAAPGSADTAPTHSCNRRSNRLLSASTARRSWSSRTNTGRSRSASSRLIDGRTRDR